MMIGLLVLKCMRIDASEKPVLRALKAFCCFFLHTKAVLPDQAGEWENNVQKGDDKSLVKVHKPK
jgi:hypothetical protein